eukprot:m.181543 g.181543  ORF g.181543 m.181543 type:complete len:212 (+) comp25457_c0_seq3:1032-1667(+)
MYSSITNGTDKQTHAHTENTYAHTRTHTTRTHPHTHTPQQTGVVTQNNPGESLPNLSSSPPPIATNNNFMAEGEQVSPQQDEHGGDDAEQEEEVEQVMMPDRAKLQLLNRFNILIQLYLLAVIFVLFINAWRNKNSFGITVTMDMLDLLAMASLLYTFRLRSENPYFLVNEYDDFDRDDAMRRVAQGEEDVMEMSLLQYDVHPPSRGESRA